MPSYSDLKYLQKVNAKCPQISDEKKFFLPLWQITFKIRIKSYLKREKTFIFHQKSEGILHSLFEGTWIRIWGHSEFIFCRYFPSESAGKYPPILRLISSDFWDEVFSLSMPSVCPHLTTVWNIQVLSAIVAPSLWYPTKVHYLFPICLLIPNLVYKCE